MPVADVCRHVACLPVFFSSLLSFSYLLFASRRYCHTAAPLLHSTGPPLPCSHLRIYNWMGCAFAVLRTRGNQVMHDLVP